MNKSEIENMFDSMFPWTDAETAVRLEVTDIEDQNDKIIIKAEWWDADNEYVGSYWLSYTPADNILHGDRMQLSDSVAGKGLITRLIVYAKPLFLANVSAITGGGYGLMAHIYEKAGFTGDNKNQWIIHN